MNIYELYVLMHPDKMDAFTQITQGVNNIVGEKNIHHITDPERIKLEYPISNLTKAQGCIFIFSLESPSSLLKLNALFKHNDVCIRYLLTRIQEQYNPAVFLTSVQNLDDKHENDTHSGSIRVDYKNIPFLRKHIFENGRIKPRHLTSFSMKKQRSLSTAIKRARFMALLPYCDRHY